MKRTVVTVAFLVFTSAFIVTIVVLPEVRATTHHVGGGGLGNYTTIQEAIDNASSGDSIYVHVGIYYENLLINKTLSIVGEDKDTTIIDASLGSHAAIRIIADWVNITSITIINATYDAGVEILHSRNCLITNTDISGSAWGIWVRESDGNIITQNTLSNNIRNIDVYISNNDTITSNAISFSSSAGIRLYSSINTTLQDNVLTQDGILISGDLMEHWITHTIDTSNTVNGKPVYYLKGLVGETVTMDAGQIILVNCTDVSIENRDLKDGSMGIGIGFSTQMTVSNNIISSQNRYGIRLKGSHNSTIANNRVMDGGTGISLSTSHGNTVHNNTVFSSEREGIYLGDSNSNFVAFNSVSSCDDGISLWGSKNNEVFNNEVSENEKRGIELWDSVNTTITYNNVRNNSEYGIRLYSSRESLIYHNNLIDNEVQAYDGTPVVNEWDKGYSRGGNYWSDYDGVDVKSGPFQSEIGSDGIGDESYTIDPYAQMDRYPLMSPVLPPNDPPICSIAAPDPGSTISGFYVIIGTAYDLDGTVERVEIRIDEGPWIQVNGTTSWSYTWSTTTVSDGWHNIQARSFDGRDYGWDASTIIVDNSHQVSIFEQLWFWMAVAVVIIAILAMFIFLIRRTQMKQEGH